MISALAVGVLFLYYLLEGLPTLLAMLLQYVIFISVVLGGLWISGHFVTLDTYAYRDIFISCTIFYAIGAVFYYIDLFQSVKKQNKMINEIKHMYQI